MDRGWLEPLPRPGQFVPADGRGRWVATAAVAGVGLLVGLAHVGLLSSRSVATALAPGAGVLFGVVLVGSAVWLARTELGSYLPVIAAWSVGAAVVFAAVGQLFRLSHPADVSLVWFLTGAGGVVGLCVGVYDATSRRARRELADEREHAEELLDRLATVNQTLQHGIRDSVEEIRRETPSEPQTAPTGPTGPTLDAPDSSVAGIRAATDRMDETARVASELTPTEIDEDRTDLVSATRRTVERVREREPSVPVTVDLPSEAPTTASQSIDIAIRALLDNAVEHAQRQVTVDCEVDTDTVRLRVADDGPGVPSAVLAALEDPDDDRVTDGDGLWMAEWAVDQADGTLSFETDDGTVATVELPAAGSSTRS